jgi:hypothetical protein
MKICKFENIGCVAQILGFSCHSRLSVWQTASFTETTVSCTVHPVTCHGGTERD